jgi:hypothetical protein
VSQGYDSASARAALSQLRVAHYNARRDAAHQDMLVGAVWCVAGIVITVLSCYVATCLGSTRYILAGGAIVYGCYRFFKGLSQLG